MAATGHAVVVVEGEPTNIKLTTAHDLEMLEALLEERESGAAAL